MTPPAIWLTVLAQQANNNNQGGSFLVFLLPIVVIMILFQLMIKGPQKREEAERQEMLKTLKKNDPVATIGGILGTVVSVSEDGSEVVVRVDEGTRLKFRRDAIREVIRKDEPAGDESKN
jgi:preprotein translocase subunit YajC